MSRGWWLHIIKPSPALQPVQRPDQRVIRIHQSRVSIRSILPTIQHISIIKALFRRLTHRLSQRRGLIMIRLHQILHSTFMRFLCQQSVQPLRTGQGLGARARRPRLYRSYNSIRRLHASSGGYYGLGRPASEGRCRILKRIYSSSLELCRSVIQMRVQGFTESFILLLEIFDNQL